MAILDGGIGLVTEKLRDTENFYREFFDARTVFDSEWFLLLRMGTAEGFELNIMRPREGMKNFGGGAVIRLRVENADLYLKRFQRAKVNPVIPMSDFPWAGRGFGVLDPSGAMALCWHKIMPSEDSTRYFR